MSLINACVGCGRGAVSALILAVLSHASAASGQTTITGTAGGQSYEFLDYTYQGLPGRLYVPDAYDPSQPTAVVTFMHGLGERGDNNTSQVVNSSGAIPYMGNLIARANADNFLVYIPQSAAGWWAESDTVVAALGQLSLDYHTDPTRHYLTGLSAGGAGVMRGLREHTSLYAAYSPLSVASRYFTSEADAQPFADVPTWYFTGFNDTPYRNNARNSYLNTLRAQGVAEADLPSFPTTATTYTYRSDTGLTRITEFANGGHNNATWNNGAYASAELYNWMFSHTAETASPKAGQTIRLSLQDTTAEPRGLTDANGRFFNSSYYYNQSRVISTFALDEAGNRTSVIFEVTDPFRGRHATTLPASAAFDESTAGNYWELYRFGDGQDRGQITIHGLEAGGLYDLGLFASVATTNTSNYLGVYSVGDQSILIDAANNDQEFFLRSLIASGDGTLVLDVALPRDEQGNILSTFAALNTLSITAVPEPAGLTLVMLSAVALLSPRARRRDRVAL